MHMIQRNPFGAWITIEGEAAEVYDVQSSGNLVTCWIASEAGKKFAVNWDNLTRETGMKATVCIDGFLCDTHIMLDAAGFPDKPNSVGVSYARTSDYTRRDFMFAPLTLFVGDDDRFLDGIERTLDLGIIKIHLYRIRIEHVESRVLEHRSGKQMLEAQVVHERSKKAGSHHVQFGKEYASPAPVIDMVRYKDIDRKPYLTFEFKYKPLELLVADSIAPRALHILSPTPGPATFRDEDRKSREPSGPSRRTKELRAKRRERLVLPSFRKRIKTEVIDLT